MINLHHNHPFHIQPVGGLLLELMIYHEVELVEEDFAPIHHIHELVSRRQSIARLLNRAHRFSFSAALEKQVTSMCNLIAMAFLVRSAG